MARINHPLLIGIDVSKAELVIARSDSADVTVVANTRQAILTWLKHLPATSKVALEATGVYHREVAALLCEAGHDLYLLDAYKLSHYRSGVGARAKTDMADARLILRYLTNELEALKPWQPPGEAFYRIQSLMRRRAKLVQTRIALSQSLEGLPELEPLARQIDTLIRRVEAVIVKRLAVVLKEVGWWEDAKRCKDIAGIGDLTAAALTNIFHRGHFRSSDAFIAYLGMDVRIRDSGKQVGRRKLTKKGDPELRRLLYNAAMAARRTRAWKPLYQSYLAQGLKPIPALVKLARKLARIAFALMKNQSTYQPRADEQRCYAT